ncbi:MAG TPA: hypothetical protein VFC19_16985 [Candidatus Limnocylindrales bacterium]|nr:hypothetical protein [Candidatus Limnocylindrales bacterium]
MTVYLDVEDLVDIATTVLKTPPMVRDYGLLASAAARPRDRRFWTRRLSGHLREGGIAHALPDEQPRPDRWQ